MRPAKVSGIPVAHRTVPVSYTHLEDEFKAFLASIGDSIVCVADSDIVKVHVHTNDPGLAIQKGLSYGSLTSMKIDNMREEHHERLFKDAQKLASAQEMCIRDRDIALFVYEMVVGNIGTKISIAMALLNFVIFFFGFMRKRVSPAQMHRRAAYKKAVKKMPSRHRCAVCGRTEETSCV